jgi:hypothetical protein
VGFPEIRLQLCSFVSEQRPDDLGWPLAGLEDDVSGQV